MNETVETNGLTVDNLTLADAKSLIWGTYNGKQYLQENCEFKSLGGCSSPHLRAIMDTQRLDIRHPIYYKAIQMILEDREKNASEADKRRIVLRVVDGGIFLFDAPDDIIVEVRDFDIPDDWEGDRHTDENGDDYQRITLEPLS